MAQRVHVTATLKQICRKHSCSHDTQVDNIFQTGDTDLLAQRTRPHMAVGEPKAHRVLDRQQHRVCQRE